MTTMLASASDDHDDLAQLVREREDALKASAAACAKMNESVKNLKRWVYGGGATLLVGGGLVALSLFSR